MPTVFRHKAVLFLSGNLALLFISSAGFEALWRHRPIVPHPSIHPSFFSTVARLYHPALCTLEAAEHACTCASVV